MGCVREMPETVPRSKSCVRSTVKDNILLSGQAAKAIVAFIGALSQLLTHYSGKWWEPAAAAGVTLLGVFLVPNAPKL